MIRGGADARRVEHVPPPMSAAELARHRAKAARAEFDRLERRAESRRRTIRTIRRRRRLLDMAWFALAFVVSGVLFQGWPSDSVALGVVLIRAATGVVAALVFDCTRGYHVVGIFSLACLADSAATGWWLDYQLHNVDWLRNSVIRWLMLITVGTGLSRVRRFDRLDGV